MQRIDKMLRLQKAGDAVDRFVVYQDRAEQRLLCLLIVRRRAERWEGFWNRPNQCAHDQT
jgi:hypothetical protein